MCAALGGPKDLIARQDTYLPHAAVVEPVYPASEGVVTAIDTRALGLSVVALGGGRTRADQPIDSAVGLTEITGVGDSVGPQRPLALVHAQNREQVFGGCGIPSRRRNNWRKRGASPIPWCGSALQTEL